MNPHPDLTTAQIERLAFLAEEMGEAIHAIGKVLRHGYGSRDPTLPPDSPTNQQNLERELADVGAAIEVMTTVDDVDGFRIGTMKYKRSSSVLREPGRSYMHHQASVRPEEAE